MRIIGALVRTQPHTGKKHGDAISLFSARADAEVDQRFLHDFTRRHARVQRGIGILEDDLHPLASVE